MTWEHARRRALERLREHLDKGLVDEDIREFLWRFNSLHPCTFTTSSCSGRIVVLEGPSLFDKRSARIVAQTHDPGECSHIYREAVRPPRGGLARWLSLQPPILHVAALTLDAAQRIVRLAEEAGFNRACYKAYRAGGFHVEIAVSDKLHIIRPDQGIVGEACRVLAQYKKKLRALEEMLLKADLCGAGRGSDSRHSLTAPAGLGGLDAPHSPAKNSGAGV